MMTKPATTSKQAELKSLANRSHNHGSIDTWLIAQVKLLARHAAEEDYKSRLARAANDLSKGDNP